MKIKQAKLANNKLIPMLGFGTYLLKETKPIYDAIATGYRLIDTAEIYENSVNVRDAVKQAIFDDIIKREDLFITSKVWVDKKTTESAIEECQREIKALGLKYLDLYLIHWPYQEHHAVWNGLEYLYKEGLVKAIGVSNYYEPHLKDLFSNKKLTIKPMLNQIELHPGLDCGSVRAFCKENKILVQAWRSLLKSHQDVFDNEILKDLAKKYQKTPVQILLNWAYSQDILIIPKSAHKERIIENFAAASFTLDHDDIKRIYKVPCGRIGPEINNFWKPKNVY